MSIQAKSKNHAMDRAVRKFLVLHDETGHRHELEDFFAATTSLIGFAINEPWTKKIESERAKLDLHPKVSALIEAGDRRRGDVDYFNHKHRRTALLVERRGRSSLLLYLVVFNSVDSTQPIWLIGAGKGSEPQWIDIGIMPLVLEPHDMITLPSFVKDYYEASLRKQGIEIPWKRVKRCYLCDARNSKSITLRVCAGCRVARFCSRRCQKVAWNLQHEKECKYIMYRGPLLTFQSQRRCF